MPVSTKDARVTMSRELVDFFENALPPLITAIVQLIAAIVILAAFHPYMALSMLLSGFSMLLLYGLFHKKFTALNAVLNDQMEQRVNVLDSGSIRAVRIHLERLKRCEIDISDTEALVYGLIFIVLFAAVIGNLWMVTLITDPSTGEIFSMVTYSLEFVDAAILLPFTLQSISRLTEITQRLNQVSSS